jgi:hypothetical protein
MAPLGVLTQVEANRRERYLSFNFWELGWNESPYSLLVQDTDFVNGLRVEHLKKIQAPDTRFYVNWFCHKIKKEGTMPTAGFIVEAQDKKQYFFIVYVSGFAILRGRNADEYRALGVTARKIIHTVLRQQG